MVGSDRKSEKDHLGISRYIEECIQIYRGFLAVQDSSIGDLVTESVSESCFDFSDFREHCRAVVDN